MSSFRVLDRQFRRTLSTIGIAAALIVPSFVPAFGAAAADVTERSVELSSASVSATNVTYGVTFKPVASSANAFAVDFCTSAVVGTTCTAPGNGFTAANAATTESGYTIADKSANRVVVSSASALTSGVAVSVPITGITNPSAPGTIYARIVTYDTAEHATADTTEDGAGLIDSGTVALSITNAMKVSGSVLESMTFCVSGQAIDAGCTNTTAPSLQLGTQTGDIYVLDTAAPSTGDVYTQLSTNAAYGAVVSLKNSVACGGMKRPEVSTCDIPALSSGFTTKQAGFGVIAAPDTAKDAANNATGTYQIVSTSGYDGSTYKMNYVPGGATGVTSQYGDPIFDTNGTQPLNRGMKLTFGAQAADNTPAGTYSADMSLVATGTF